MATIMLLEDNLIYRELLRELCEMDGHEVVEFPCAEDALAVLRNYHELDVHRRHRRIDLFITDFNLEGINGFEFIQELRSLEDMRDVPIVMISSTAKDMRDLLKLENVAFLTKPCPNSSVMVTVRNLLQSAAARRGEAPSPARPAVAAESAAKVERLLSSVLPVHPPKPNRLPPAPAPKRLPPAPPRSVTPPQPPASRPTPAPAQAKSTPPAPPAIRPPAPPAEKASSGAPPADFGRIDDGLKSSISSDSELTEFLISRQKPAAETRESSLQGVSPVADLVEKILDGAIRRGASDIHIEPQAGVVEVRARVDGVLQRLVSLPATVADNLAARIKILCGLNITEKRLPQDGQFTWRGSGGAAGKFRVSTLPSMHGEKVVVRILPSDNLGIKLDALGFTPEELNKVRGILRSPNGLLLATGPTGSGKTTTLYTLLDSLNTRERNIITVEDPVEYQLPGITQVQVNAGIGYTFERVLRSFLRQDPNVMLVGEIRDEETAKIALKVAVTGHLVLSSLHTNDAAGAVHRLLSMGLPAYLVAAAARLVIAQRLVRKLCLKCRVAGTLSGDESCLLAPEEAAALSKIWRPKGCPACHGVGYSGRRPVYEILTVMSHEMRSAVSRAASPEELKTLAVREGMVPIRRKALQQVAEGVTSIEEALAVLFV